METGSSSNLMLVMMLLSICLKGAYGIRFVIDREECLSHNVQYEGDTVQLSFVVIKADGPWHYGDEGVDLLIKGPSSDQIHNIHDKISEKYEFMAHKKGLYRFCFTNKSPYHETIDFDVHVGHSMYHDQHAKDEHFNPLLEQISKLEEALYNIQFEQHWLEAQTDRQALAPPRLHNPFRHLTELQVKREEGLRFRCDEKYTIGHRCNNKELLIVSENGDYLEEGQTCSTNKRK
ncbi:Transmembrane emp24 domain-containing protein p24 beta 2 [Abeliophyllum distichum]|uniref:Transmembrane emp24 domain-containing protein p24 beta 2 n=1 Tax=Abeliophyllum distichum TaxID=126358 RepID=A0ABD1QE08_9LAMI